MLLPIVLALTLALPAAPQAAPVSDPPVPRKPEEGGSLIDHARTLPALERTGGVVKVPLADPGRPWREVRPGITITPGPSLEVSYTRTRAQPAGAAFVLRPGDLAGMESVRIDLRGTRPDRLSVCLTDTDGVVWTLPSVKPVDGANAVELRVADIGPDPYQNRGRVAGGFDAAKVYMVTVLDINGYMSTSEPKVAWRVHALEGVVR